MLEYTSGFHLMEAALCRWQAATVGYYHNKRCFSVALSVWIRQTVALSHEYQLLRNTTVATLLSEVRAMFFTLWKQTINLRILGEHRHYRRAKRFIHLWRTITYYVRKARTSRNMFEISQPMLILKVQVAELKLARGLVHEQWYGGFAV